jgi:hypothetical protein
VLAVDEDLAVEDVDATCGCAEARRATLWVAVE